MGQYLIAANDDFQCDQHDNYLLKAEGSLCVDNVGEGLRSVRVYCGPVLRHPADLIQAANFTAAVAF